MQGKTLVSWSSSVDEVYARWKTVFAGLIGSCACTIIAFSALLASSGTSNLQLQGIQQAWGQLCAVAVPAILRTPEAQLYATLICAAMICAYAVIVEVSAGQRFMPALGAADRHNAPWAPVRGVLNGPVQPADYVQLFKDKMGRTAIADTAEVTSVGQMTSTAQPIPVQDRTREDDTAEVVLTTPPGPGTPLNTDSLPWPSASVWPASSNVADGANMTQVSALSGSLTTPAGSPAIPAVVAMSIPTPVAPSKTGTPEVKPPLPHPSSSGVTQPASSAMTPERVRMQPLTAVESRTQIRQELEALRWESLTSFGQAARRPSTPVAAPAALFAVAADAFAPGWESSPLAAATARAGITAAETAALATSPFAPLFSVERGPITFQVPTVRSRYDPMVALMASSPSAHRPAWDPVASVLQAVAPTRAAFGRSALDPASYIAGVRPPTGGTTWDPLQRLRRATAPTRASHGHSPLDPLSYVTLARAPSGGITWDPLQQLKQKMPPTRAVVGKSILDPLSYIASVRKPVDGRSWDPVHALVNAQVPRGGKTWDPFLAAVQARVPKHRTVWDPLHALRAAEAPAGHSMLDPIHALTRVDVPRNCFSMDPMSSLRKISQPAGTPKWDPLRLLRKARVGKVSIGTASPG